MGSATAISVTLALALTLLSPRPLIQPADDLLERKVLTVAVGDRFGHHGVVGVMAYRVECGSGAPVMGVDAFLLRQPGLGRDS